MKKILVVEDDPVNVKVLQDFLTAHGYDTSIARNGAEALVRFHDTQPDLMLIDIQLPRKNGFEVCFEVRRSPHGRSLPVLFMSAVYPHNEHADRYTERLKAQGFLAKPFELTTLLEHVTDLIGPAEA